jgi:hypothetical protein
MGLKGGLRGLAGEKDENNDKKNSDKYKKR